MKWQLSEEQESYRSTMADWLSDVASVDRVRTWFEAADGSEFTARLTRNGWAGVGVPEELGGQGGGLVELALTAELFGRTAVPSSTWLADVLAAPLLASRPEVAEAAFSGEHVALLVPAGSVPGGPSPLRLDAEGRVGGRVLRVLGAADATQYVAVAGPEGGRPELRLVRADDARVERRDLLDRSRSVADVVLEDAPSVSLEGDVDAVLGEVARRGDGRARSPGPFVVRAQHVVRTGHGR
jgi:alkylation response protein AidB-like acyl-CoA dehydrogenase